MTRVDHDDELLDVGQLAAEQCEQRLSSVRSLLLEMAARNANFLDLDSWAELLRQAADVGVVQEQAESYLREVLCQQRIRLSRPASAPLAGADGSGPPPQGTEASQPGEGGPAGVKWCPQCSREAACQDQFCGQCALPLHCPRCGRDFQIGEHFCPACGLDPVRHRQFRTHVEAGRRLLQSARTPAAAAAERLRFARQASQAFTDALACSPDDLLVQSQATAARQLTTALLWEVFETACRDRQFSWAIALLRQLALDPAEMVRANVQIQELLAGRHRQLADARCEAANGKWDRAVQLLSEVQRSFPEDSEVNRLLLEYQEKAALVQTVLQDRIPTLRQAKQITALLEVCLDLEKKQLNLGWLPTARETCQKRIEKADQLADRCEQFLAAGRLEEALAQTEQALALVADHTRALRLHGAIEERTQRSRHWKTQLDSAWTAQRWFLADLALNQLNQGGRKESSAPQRAHIQTGMAQANQFLQFVAWTCAGSLLLWLGAHMALLLTNELAGWLPERLFGLAPLSRQVVQPAAFVTGLAVLSFLLLAFLLTCFRRPLTFPAVARGFGLVLLAAGGSSLLWSVWTYHAFGDDQSFLHGLLRALGTFLLLAGLGAILGFVAVTLAGNLLPLPTARFSSLHQHAIRAGAVAICLCLMGWQYQRFLLGDVPVVVLLFGLLTLAGIVVHGHFYQLVLAALISGGLTGTLAALRGSPGHWLPGIVTWTILTGGAFFISEDRRWPHDVVRTSLLAAVALGAHWLLASDLGSCVLVSAWVFVCGTIARQHFLTADRRLHLLDRLRLWWTR